MFVAVHASARENPHKFAKRAKDAAPKSVLVLNVLATHYHIGYLTRLLPKCYTRAGSSTTKILCGTRPILWDGMICVYIQSLGTIGVREYEVLDGNRLQQKPTL